MYRNYIECPVGLIEVEASDTGVTSVAFVDVPQTVLPNAVTEQAIEQLKAYLAGDRTEFDLKLAPVGTEFQAQVWTELQKIPYAALRSYSDIARNMGNPRAVRAVGAANGKNPIAIIVPCHRVIGADGQLTGYAGGLERKAWLLQHEGAII